MSSFRGVAGMGRLAMIALVLTPGLAIAGGKGWSHDMAAAMKQAKEEKKELLLDFTGSDWCGWCIKLNEEVFSQDAFKDDAKEHFVLVEFDFPNDKSHLSAETQKQNDEWNKKLAVQGYPTIYVADEEGRPYAQTGYQPGGAEAYVAHLTELRGKRVARDEAFAKAAESQGAEKAKLLDAALAIVGEDLALNAYTDQVKEIIAADASNEAGLKGKYEQKLADVEFDRAVAQLDGTFDGKNADELIAGIDQAIERHKPSSARVAQATLNNKLRYLLAAQKQDEALALIDKLLADPSDDVMMKLNLGFAKANILRQLGRADDALKAMDDVIAAAPAENDLKARVAAQKGMMLVAMNKKDEALKAFDAAASLASSDEFKDQISQLKERLAAQQEKPAEPTETEAEPKADE